LNRLTVPQLAFERFLTFFRRRLLEELEAAPLGFILALASYCRQNGYIFYVEASEQQHRDALIAGFKAADVEDRNKLAVLCCYESPASLLDRLNLSPSDIAGETGAWLRIVMDEDARLRSARQAIRSLTPVSDTVSAKVQEQYEHYPYPFWNGYSAEIKGEAERGLSGRKASILVAGCGTGMEAVELAAAFPDARILAVDLSANSLAYAQMKADSFNIANIEFRQADILELGMLDRRFDFIACSGVLHHMREPEAGLAVLTQLLVPDGLMRIALYSTRGRRFIAQARQAIAASGRYPANDEGMRAFRYDGRKIIGRKAWKNIASFVDFYFMAECRDLLFHVQEHTFTPLQVRDFLDRFGLRTMELHLPPGDKLAFSRLYPQSEAQCDLPLWDAFEAKRPDTFRRMIRLWCIKK
jgi:2-polyprenyl-3-methyl-5-hydroxy-6-metoxy-1,4-benzoquinol methylase